MKYENLKGKFTLEMLSDRLKLTKNSTLNLLSKLRKEGRVRTSGGRDQKRIYTIYKIPTKKTNGFYDIVNKFSKIKLVPAYNHYTYGKYSVEHAIIHGILSKDIRTIEATKYLFNHVRDWKLLFELAKKKSVTDKVYELYKEARKSFKCKKMPKRYER